MIICSLKRAGQQSIKVNFFKKVKMQNETTAPSSTEKTMTEYPLRCTIVDNVVIGDEGPLFEKCLSFGELLFEKLNSNPDFIGQINSVTGERATFAEIKERSVRCALWLTSRGVQRGDIVGIATNNHSDCSTTLLGCLFICAPFYAMHHQQNIDDSRYFLSLVKPKLVFVNADLVETMAKAAERENLIIEFVTFGYAKGFRSFEEIVQGQDAAAIDEFRCKRIFSLDEPAALFLSSGSTGPSKATLMSHRALINNMIYDDSFATEEQTVVMWFSTLRWVTGTQLIFRAIYLYKTRIICDKYDEKLACKLIEKYNVAYVWFLPSLIASILKNDLLQKYHLPSLKRMTLGGANMKPHLQEALMKALPHTEIIFVYGMSECGVITTQRQGDTIGSAGYILKNAQMKVVDINTGKALGPNQVGEFLWKAPYTMTGYYNDPQATKKVLDEDGWLHSGDVGYYDENGEVYICDRVTDTIRVDGFMVYPTEVENVLHSHPAVREVAVVRVYHDILDECPFAFVSKIPGMEVAAEELIKLVADNLEDYKHLHGLQFLDELPHTDTGKIARKQLRDMAEHFMSNCVSNI